MAMRTSNKIILNRRHFNGGVLTFGALSFIPNVAFSKYHSSKADALIQLKNNGKLYLYSGAGHMGIYGDYSAIESIAKVSGCSIDELVIVQKNNPVQLPCVLGQKTDPLSYSDVNTVLRAAKVLSQMRAKHKSIPKTPVIMIEKAVSNSTRIIINTLEQQGIIVAVKG